VDESFVGPAAIAGFAIDAAPQHEQKYRDAPSDFKDFLLRCNKVTTRPTNGQAGGGRSVATPLRAYYADHFVLPLPPGHRFPMGKYRLLRDRLDAEMAGQIAFDEASPASDGELALAHTPDYINAIANGTASAQQMREIGFPWSEAMVQRARRSVGATVAAARHALQAGVAANLAGGTHHASADKGGGYCVFNDVAVAARLMQVEWHRHHRQGLRVLVVDLDVHQGNGTAAIFRDDPSVFTFSMHGEKNFPFRKEPSDWDVDLPDGTGDAAYLNALDAALAEVWRRFARRDAPGATLAFYVAGADAHEGDRLGRLKLTTGGMAERDRRVFAALGERGIPVAMSMAGGYGHDLATTVEVQMGSFRAAISALQAWTMRG
jgi:acetoin utilization deacetylase AcuC-like enzyme